MVAFSEALALAEVSGLQQKDVVEIAGLGAYAAPMYKLKASSFLDLTQLPACGKPSNGLAGWCAAGPINFAVSCCPASQNIVVVAPHKSGDTGVCLYPLPVSVVACLSAGGGSQGSGGACKAGKHA